MFEKIQVLNPLCGEVEVTDVNNFHVQEGSLTYETLDGWSTDAWTLESHLRVNNLVAKTGANKISEEAGVATVATPNVGR